MSDQLSLLVRKNIGAKILLDLEKEISQRTGIQKLCFLTLEESDKTRDRFLKLFAELQNQKGKIATTNFQRPDDLHTALAELACRLNGESVLVFFQDSDRVGALRLRDTDFFSKAGILLDIDEDSIYACYEDLSSGIVLDKEGVGKLSLYETQVWGGKWNSPLK